MKLSVIFAVILAGLFVWGCGSKSNPSSNQPPGDVYIVANTSVTIPADMMSTISNIWNAVTSYTVPIGEYPSGSGFYDPNIGFNTSATLKAIVKDDTLYIYASWTDGNASRRLDRLHLSITDQPWSILTNEGEDVFFIIFDAGNNGTERADCATMCHAVGDTREHYTSGGGNADVWIWRAARTAPAYLDDDGWWDDAGTDLDYPAGSDAVYKDNYNNIAHAPYFTHYNLGAYTGDFLFTHDTVHYVQANFTAGDEVPGFVIDSMFHDTSTADLSRWDVHSYSLYDNINHKWDIVMSRALDTGHDDDVDLSSVDTVQVTIAVNHNYPANSPNKHSGSKPFYIIINPQ